MNYSERRLNIALASGPNEPNEGWEKDLDLPSRPTSTLVADNISEADWQSYCDTLLPF